MICNIYNDKVVTCVYTCTKCIKNVKSIFTYVFVVPITYKSNFPTPLSRIQAINGRLHTFIIKQDKNKNLGKGIYLNEK